MEFKPKIDLKVWDLQIEKEILKKWEKEWKELYGFNLKTNKKIFVIDTPPPYPGPFWHIGAAVSYAFQDIVARAFRMLGFEVLFPIGIDRNGIPVEWYVEKYEGISIWDFPREEFVKKCSTILDNYTQKMLNIMKRLLISGDFENVYFTDSEEYRILTQATFIEAWKKGLIYEAERPTIICPRCRTPIAHNEVEHKQFLGTLYYIKFEVEGREVIIATTRPELLAACKLVIYNPSDERYKWLKGKKAKVPLFDFEVPIMERNEANPEFGTGLVMICSYGDLTDVRILRELKIKPTILIDQNGKFKLKGFEGLSVKEAREKVIEMLKEKGLIVKEEKIQQSIPVHDKCKNPVEIITMKEYYLKQLEFLDDLRKIADQIKWHPEHHKQKLLDWINSVITDWPISRRRYYGTEIPLWKCKKCGFIYVPKPGRYYRPWKEKLEIECPKCKSKEWEGETRIFDTWFDSSVSVLLITKYLKDKEFFEKTFLNGIKLRPQGYDIVRTWLYYSLLRVFQLTGRKAFEHVLIHGMGLDEKGRKMSKSLGNVIYPEEILENYGADPLRLWVAMECTVGSDYRISKEKIKGTIKFLTKLLNIARFISQFPIVEKAKLQPSDRWILAELMNLKQKVLKYYEDMDFHLAAQSLYKFAWDIFASHYLELIKCRALLNGFSEEEAKSAWFACHYCLKEILKLLAPIIPATTDFLYRKIYGKSVHLEEFGSVEKEFLDKSLLEIGKKLMEFNSRIWNEKRSKGLSLKTSIKTEIPEELKDFEKDLKAMHKIK